MKILVVDDNEDALRSYEIGLDSLGEVIIESSPRKAIANFKSYMPDLVITDLYMPEMNGVDFISHIKKIKPDQMIVVITSFSDDLLLKSDSFLDSNSKARDIKIFIKPVEIIELLDYIKLLDIRKT